MLNAGKPLGLLVYGRVMLRSFSMAAMLKSIGFKSFQSKRLVKKSFQSKCLEKLKQRFSTCGS